MFPWYCLPVADAMVTECRQDAPSELEKRCLTRCGAMHGGFSMVPQMEALWKSPLTWKKTGGPHGNWKPSNMIVFAKPPMKSNELLRCFCFLRVLMLFIPSVLISGMIFDASEKQNWGILRDLWFHRNGSLQLKLDGNVHQAGGIDKLSFPFFSPVHQSMKGRVSSLHRDISWYCSSQRNP